MYSLSELIVNTLWFSLKKYLITLSDNQNIGMKRKLIKFRTLRSIFMIVRYQKQCLITRTKPDCPLRGQKAHGS